MPPAKVIRPYYKTYLFCYFTRCNRMKITVLKVLSGLMIAVSFSCFATMEAAWDLDENGNDSVEAQALHEKCPSHVLIKSKSGKVVDHAISNTDNTSLEDNSECLYN